MLRLIPWDVLIAAALAIVAALAAIFEPAPIVFIAIYLAMCAYIVVETFSNELG